MKRARIKKCPVCYGEVAVYGGHAVDELRGGSYQRWLPCPNAECDDGWVEDPDTVSVAPFLVAVAIVLVAVMALMAGLHQSAPRSSPDPTASPSLPASGISGDLSRSGASGLGSSGAPSVAVGAPFPAQGQLGTPLIAGGANFAEVSHGPNYLAMRLPRQTRVRICGDGACQVMVTNDVGPKNRAKVADIALDRFAVICGFVDAKGRPDRDEARRMGICPVEIEVLGHGAIALPATDTAP